jgi:hypothetical protein
MLKTIKAAAVLVLAANSFFKLVASIPERIRLYKLKKKKEKIDAAITPGDWTDTIN